MKKLFLLLGLVVLLGSCSRSITMDQAASGKYKKGRAVK